MLLGRKPANLGKRTLTLAEEQALVDADQLEAAQVLDLEKAGWTFTRWVAADEAAPAVSGDGPLLAAVRSDLGHIDKSGGAKASLAALALWLAEVIDRRGSEGGASTAARLGQELRATLQALTAERTGGDPATLQQVLAGLSTPAGPDFRLTLFGQPVEVSLSWPDGPPADLDMVRGLLLERLLMTQAAPVVVP